MSTETREHQAAQRVVRAWADPGPYPMYHYAIRAQVRHQWPVLAAAIDALVLEHVGNSGEEPHDRA